MTRTMTRNDGLLLVVVLSCSEQAVRVETTSKKRTYDEQENGQSKKQQLSPWWSSSKAGLSGSRRMGMGLQKRSCTVGVLLKQMCGELSFLSSLR